MVSNNAIIVRNVKKSYGTNVILNGLNMTVKKGTIYGFLGSSGSGKTTLLSCMVGVKKVDSGDIWILGGKPGSKNSGIPGPRVGYMPQEISLIDEFSIIGAFYFFGRVNGMEDDEIEKGYTELKDLLQLPPRNRLVKDISGGQQRRVSFGVALLHKPELLILDEPTVGLDPVLRDNLWCHLEKIAKEGVTVIITTHYIEETKQANKIGLIRNGKLLAESTPSDLLERFQTDSLEEAFLTLSQVQENSDQRNENQVSNTCADSNEPPNSTLPYLPHAPKEFKELYNNRKKRCHALLVKNLLQFVRYPGGVLFSLLLPIMQMFLFFNSIGLYSEEQVISIVNNEAGNCDYGRNQGNITYNQDEYTCTMTDISCRFINGINDTIPNKIFYDSYEEAQRDVGKQKSIAIMHFHSNFSASVENRLENLLDVPESVIETSKINIVTYIIDSPTYFHTQQELYKSFFNEYEKIMEECGTSPKLANVPIYFEEPVYGSKDQTYLSFIVPTFVLTMLFVLATSLCSSVIITERHSGLWDRNIVQGVTTPEILITHLISQIAIVLIQVTITLCIFFLYFDVKCRGSIGTAIWLAVLGGISGTSYGMAISVFSNDQALANYVSVGTFYPLVLLSGLIWPIEAMPTLLRWFSSLMPLTMPGIAFRGILEKGTSFDEPEVYIGFLVTIGWILGCISISLFQLRLKTV